MDKYIADDFPWQCTVGQLDTGRACQLAARVSQIIESYESSRLSNNDTAVAIALLERLSPRMATVSWSDPQGCKYGEQVWRLSTARGSGICALSGQPIFRGNAIYRPAKVEPRPANAAAMILATVIDRAFADTY